MGGLQPKRWKDNANASCELSFRRVAFIALLILLLLSISRFCLQVPRFLRTVHKRRMSFFHIKITVLGVFHSELVDRAASHAACMAFESLWSTSPFTLPARLWKFSLCLSRSRHERTLKSALCEPESSCHFRDFRFVLSIRLAAWSPVQCETCAANLHIWGVRSGLPRPFGFLKF